MTNATKFKLTLASVKPGDFGPSGYAVYNEKCECVVIRSGSVVEAIGDVTVGRDHGDNISFRMIRTSSGFEGLVCWVEFDGRSGFEPVT
jgi:hypothetical protein